MRRLLLLALLPALAGCGPLLQDPGPLVLNDLPPREPELGDSHFLASDGIDLPVRSWRPADGPPSAVVVALHGFNDYSNAFDTSATEWAAEGVLTYAYDQRGFGDSEQRGVWAGVDPMVRDLVEMSTTVRARHPELPLFLLGHSMGGAVVMTAAGRAAMGGAALPYDGLVLVAPAVYGRETMNGAMVAGLDTFAYLTPWFPVSGAKTGRTPSDNVEMLRGLSKDDKVIKITRIDAVYGLVNLMDQALAAVPLLPPNTLILLGGREDIVPSGSIHRLLSTLPEPPPRVAIYADGFHMLLRDRNGPTVRADVAAWIADPTAPLPSGADATGAERVAEARATAAEEAAQRAAAPAPAPAPLARQTAAERRDQ